MKLTEKEITAILAIANSGCEEIGAESFTDLLADNMTWFNREQLSRDCRWNKNEAAGVMSALEAKGLAHEADQGSLFGWALTETGIREAMAHA
jgi:hypothetical protein